MPVFNNREKGFTFLELVVVITIIGILATIGIAQFFPVKERAINGEAIANLRLIMAAERVYRMENNFYYPYTGTQTVIANINTMLKLLLPGGADRNWNYAVEPTNTAAPQQCCAQAQSTTRAGRARTFRLRNTDANPVEGTGDMCP